MTTHYAKKEWYDAVLPMANTGYGICTDVVNLLSFENTDSQIGSNLRVDYNASADKLSYTSTLTLYSNYLRNPQNVDLDWTNQLAYEIFKNFQLTLLANVFYDDDVLVQITDKDFPNGVNGLGNRVSITQQLLLKYTAVF